MPITVCTFFTAFQSPLGSGTYKGQTVRISPTTGVASCYAAIPFPAANTKNEVSGVASTANGNLVVFMTGGDVYKTIKSQSNDFAGISLLGNSNIHPVGLIGGIRGDLASCGVGIPNYFGHQPSSTTKYYSLS